MAKTVDMIYALMPPEVVAVLALVEQYREHREAGRHENATSYYDLIFDAATDLEDWRQRMDRQDELSLDRPRLKLVKEKKPSG